jgi:hypothetical protein
MSDSQPSTIRDILGCKPSSSVLREFVESLCHSASCPPEAAVPEVKSYPDAVYFNFFRLGISLLFSPQAGYKPKTGLKQQDLDNERLLLDSVDLYNVPQVARPNAPSKPSRPDTLFSSYPVSSSPLSLILNLLHNPDPSKPRPEKLVVKAETTGKDFVSCFGEPGRKGGGSGPSSGSIGIWCEWPQDGVMVEFGGDESRGPQAWEKGKDAVWKVITIFPPKMT